MPTASTCHSRSVDKHVSHLANINAACVMTVGHCSLARTGETLPLAAFPTAASERHVWVAECVWHFFDHCQHGWVQAPTWWWQSDQQQKPKTGADKNCDFCFKSAEHKLPNLTNTSSFPENAFCKHCFRQCCCRLYICQTTQTETPSHHSYILKIDVLYLCIMQRNRRRSISSLTKIPGPPVRLDTMPPKSSNSS